LDRIDQYDGRASLMRNRKTKAENRFIWAMLVFVIIVLAIAFYYYATR
jgi:hypothetical protein